MLFTNLLFLGLLITAGLVAAPATTPNPKAEILANVRKLKKEAKPADRPLFNKLEKAALAINDKPETMARYLIEQANISDIFITRGQNKDVEASIQGIAEMASAAQNLKSVGAADESKRLLTKAAEHAKGLAEKNPQRTDVHFLLASIYYYNGQGEEMRAPLKRCLEIDPNDEACKEKMSLLE